MLNIKDIKKDFPILERKVNNKRLVYLDNAATSQRPLSVVKAVSDFYLKSNANVHRGIHTLSEEASKAFEEVYAKTASFMGSQDKSEIIFTQNTTMGINMVAEILGETSYWSEDGEIVVTEMEHHSNILPWIALLKGKRGVQGLSSVKNLKVAKINSNGELDLDHFKSLLNKNTKMVAVTHVSNVLGSINPIKEIVKITKENSNSLVLVDGAQAAPHIPINVKSLGCDFYVFSAHKMLGPTGVGVLWGKKEILQKLPPFLVGGGMIKEVNFSRVSWANLPDKFLAGTPNIGGVIGFGAALDYLRRIGMKDIFEHERELTAYTLGRLADIPKVEVYGPESRGGVVSFNVKGVHAHDLASILDAEGIAIRSGHHCAMPLHKRLGINSSARASFYFYNNIMDIDRLLSGIRKAKRIFGV